MGLWILLLIWVLLTNRLLKNGESKVMTVNDNYETIQFSKGYLIGVFSIPFIIVASRIEFIDTSGYIDAFNNLNADFSSLSNTNETGYELFRFIQIFIKHFISSDPQIYIFVIALIQSLLLLITLKKYSCNLFYSVFLFISSGMMLSWMCNGIRQFLAAVILFAFTYLLLNKKSYLYIIIAVILMGFGPIAHFFGFSTIPWFLGGIHQSVAVVLVALFFVKGKPFNFRILSLIIAIIIIAVIGQFNNVISFLSSDTSYASDVQYMIKDTGLNPIRFLVSLVPIAMIIIRRDVALSTDTPDLIKLSINMSLISSALYFAAVFTSGIFVGRLPIYFELYNLILIPWIIEHLYCDYKKIIAPWFFILYITYYIYQLIAWNASSYVISLFGTRISF